MSSTKHPPPSPQIPGLHDPQTDSFQKFNKDPRLEKSVRQNKPSPHSPDWPDELATRLKHVTGREDYFNEMRLFKKEKLASLAKLEDNPFTNRAQILSQITLVAESLIKNTLVDATQKMRTEHGLPTYQNAFLQTETAEVAIIGMGELGARVLNYASDLEVQFLYSHWGESRGKIQISNQDYFARLAQDWRQQMSLSTEHGPGYAIGFDPEVSLFDHFLAQQMKPTQGWEGLARLRARPLAGESEFLKKITAHLEQISLKQHLMPAFYANIKSLRDTRITKMNPETERGVHLKGASGLMIDLDLILLGLQIKNQPLYPDLRTSQPFELVQALRAHSVIEKNEIETLAEAQLFYYTLISKLHLQKKSDDCFWVWDSDETQEIAATLQLTAKDIQEKIVFFRQLVQSVYQKYYESP